MNERGIARVAWALVSLQVAAGAFAYVLARANAAQLDLTSGFRGSTADVVWLASWLGFPAVGAVIVSRRPRNAVGWVMCAIGGAATIGVLAAVYARYALAVRGGSIPGGSAAAWIATWVANPAALVPFLVFLFPEGRVTSAGWRRVVRGGAIAAAAFGVWRAIAPGPIDGIAQGPARVDNPLGVHALHGIAEPVTVLLALALVGLAFSAIGYTVGRFRRSTGHERQQLKWFAFSAVLFPVTVGVGALIDLGIFSLLGETLSGRAMGTEHGVVGLPVAFFVSFTGLAVSVGLAVLRYRLYAIDRIINRTLVYGVITAALGAGYALAIFGLGGILRPFTGGDDLAVAVSTLALLGAFGRVRRRVQMFADRRFDRARYDAAREIHAFSRRLRGSADLESLSTELQDLVCRTMQPAHASLWLRPIDEAHG